MAGGEAPFEEVKMTVSARDTGHILLLTGLLLVLGCNTGKTERTETGAAAGRAGARAALAGRLGEAPGTYEIADDTAAVRIPFEFYGMNLLINAKMNGRKVKFLIDNGRLWDAVWFYDGEAESLDLHYAKDAETGAISGAGEEGGSDIIDGNDIDIDFGVIRFLDQPTLISPHEAGWGAFFPGVAGQVSSMLFKHFIVTFDFDENVMVLTRPEEFDPSGKGTAVPMRLEDNGAFSIPVTLRTAGSEDRNLMLDIDLGGIYALSLIENPAIGIRRPENADKELLGYGASGRITGYKGEIDTVAIGGHALGNVVAVFVETDANASDDIIRAGTVGLPLMKRFNITFDYFNMVLYLKPNAAFGDPVE